MARPKLSAWDKRLRAEIANNLNRIACGMTQKEIAEKTGIPASTLSGYFNQTSTIIEKNLIIIAKLFNVDEGDIDPRYKGE